MASTGEAMVWRTLSPQNDPGLIPSRIHFDGLLRGLAVPRLSQKPTSHFASWLTLRSSTDSPGARSGIDRISLALTRIRYRQTAARTGSTSHRITFRAAYRRANPAEPAKGSTIVAGCGSGGGFRASRPLPPQY